MRTSIPRVLGIAAAVALVTTAAGGARASEWALDPDHTNIGFSVRHMMVSDVHGSFGKYTGTINVDDKDVKKSKIAVDVDTASVDTKAPKRDGHLKSPDFFDSAKFPTMKFVSKKIDAVSAKKLKVAGDLTIRGVTKPVVLDVDLSDEWTDPKDWGGNTHRGVHATAVVNRKDFGLVWQKNLDNGGVVVGDAVTIAIDAELIKKK